MMSISKTEWMQEIIRQYKVGHYRRALLMLAANYADDGDVCRMITSYCMDDNVEPMPHWRYAGRGDDKHGEHN